MDTVVELRVHGTGGATASEFLRHPHPVLVAGDATAGFWRRSREDAHTEAMIWGAQTSGKWRHAFWVLLLPFGLTNAAGYMHKPGGRVSRLVRVFALLLTVVVVLQPAAFMYDVVAIQCSELDCQGMPWLSGVLAIENAAARLVVVTLFPAAVLMILWLTGRHRYDELEEFDSDAADDAPKDAKQLDLTHRQFFCGAEPTYRIRLLHLSAGRLTIAAALAASLWAVESDRGWLVASAVCGVFALAFGLLAVFDRVHQRTAVPWLRVLLAMVQLFSWVAVAFVVWAGLLVGDIAVDAVFNGWWQWIILAFALLTLVATFILSRKPDSNRALPLPGLGGLYKVASSAVAAVVGAWLGAKHEAVLTWLDRLWFNWMPEPPASLTTQTSTWWMSQGVFEAPYWMLMVPLAPMLLVLILLWVSNMRGPTTHRDDSGELTPSRRGFWGQGPFVACSLALLMVVTFAAGAGFILAQRLARCPAGASLCTPADVQLPRWYLSSAMTLVALLILIGLTAGWTYIRGRRMISTDNVRDSFYADGKRLVSGLPDSRQVWSGQDLERARRIRGLWGWSRMLIGVDVALVTAIVAGWVAAVFAVYVVSGDQLLPEEGLTASPDPWPAVLLWVVGILPLAIVALVRLATSSVHVRRVTGWVWDVLSFWPRQVHPFAPPCYSERTVPQLRERLGRLVTVGVGDIRDRGAKADRIVLAGHSQGSVICAAAVLSLDTEIARRVHLVTYGSPLGILHERFFPAYFQRRTPRATPVFEHLWKKAASWHNFYCKTDVFSYPIFKVTGGDLARRGRCPICLWTDAGGAAGPHQPQLVDQSRHDWLLADPHRWATGDPPPPHPRGHSAYHEHDAFQQHLEQLASRSSHPSAAGLPDATQDPPLDSRL